MKNLFRFVWIKLIIDKVYTQKKCTLLPNHECNESTRCGAQPTECLYEIINKIQTKIMVWYDGVNSAKKT